MKKLLKDERGSVLVEAIVRLLLVCVLVMISLHIFAMMTSYQHTVYTAKAIAKIIEQEGAYDYNADNTFNELQNLFHKNNKTMKLKVTANYLDNVNKTIQFRDKFTVEVTDYYEFPIIEPLEAATLSIRVPMRAEVTGMSEVYYK